MGAIDALLTEQERLLLLAYRDPKQFVRRAGRLSMQYAVGGAIFLYLAIQYDAIWSIGIYIALLDFILIRWVGARVSSRGLPEIFDKYDQRIMELEGALEQKTQD